MSEGTVLDALATAIRRSAEHAANAERPPAAILWPDQAGQWVHAARRLRDEAPVLTLGTYDAAELTGPAYWIRCVVDGALDAPGEGIPIVYLPGHARTDIRAVEDGAAELKPLAELQYRGVIFSQKSGRDWTLLAFLQASAARGGLGIDVASDEATKAALLRASDRLLNEPVEKLRRTGQLRARHFDALMTPDIDRDVLRWLNDPVQFKASLSSDRWDSFGEQFRETFNLELEAGEVEVAYALGTHSTDVWGGVWRAFADAPERYPGIPARLRAARPKKARLDGLWDSPGAWPQDNEEAEASLRADLASLATMLPEAAREKLHTLEPYAAARRSWVWAELGAAPLARAMEPLARLAQETATSVPPGPISAIVDAYTTDRWRPDDAVMRALEAVESVDDRAAVGAAVRAVYAPWLETGAERMATAIRETPTSYVSEPLPEWPTGTCVIFTDGLRFDLGLRLADALRGSGADVTVQPRLTALPSITPTAKPATTPIASTLKPGAKFGVRAADAGPELTAEGLRKVVRDAGYQTLEGGLVGDSTGRAWSEQGDIDALGHEHQALLPSLIDSEIRKLAARVRELLGAGWRQVVVVTDHGWLYLPEGLPKAELPLHLTQDAGARKGRAARLAEGVVTDLQVVPWHWDPSVRIALAPGIRVFSGSPVYEHGGVSPQECITPVVIARSGAEAGAPASLSITVAWAGLRARIAVAGFVDGWSVDIRRAAGDGTTSLVGGARALDADGKSAVLVEDEDLEGSSASLVLLDAAGSVLAEESVVVGGSE